MAQGDESGKAFLRCIGTCRGLNPFPPLSLPSLPSLLLGVFLDATLRYTTLSLSLSCFSFFPSPSISCLGVPGCFRHSWEPFSSSLGVSLDACVVAGNIVVSFFFSSFPSSLPTPPNKRGIYNRFFNEVWLVIGWALSFGSLFIAPLQTSFRSFLSCPFCLRVPSSSPFSSLARTSVRPLLCIRAPVHFKEVLGGRGL